MTSGCLLVEALLNPVKTAKYSIPEWELCIRQARASHLLARLAVTLEDEQLGHCSPPPVKAHFVAARQYQAHLSTAIRNEVAYIETAIRATGTRLVLLKGAAYELAGLSPSRSRIYNDIDLLVEKDKLKDVETNLMVHGWSSTSQDTYDERYYRQWMHEIPPMRHIERHSVIDVHHNLVPETSAIRVDPAKLLKESRPCPNNPEVHVLAPDDMILHSAIHLFNDGEFDHALRDLFDIRDLVRETVRSSDDWKRLITRAEDLGLQRPLYYAVRYLSQVLQEDVAEPLNSLRTHAPSAAKLALLDSMFIRGLQPQHASCDDFTTSIARFSLYVRGHALRMPLRLLLPHLAKKSRKRLLNNLIGPRDAG